MFLLMMPLMLIGQTIFSNDTIVNAEIPLTFWEQFFGTIPASTYLAGGIFIAFGILISWYIKSKNGQKNNPDTPSVFSWRLFWFSKMPRKIVSVLVNIVVGFVAMRFTNDLFGMALTMFFCLIIGITFDRIIIMISKLKLPTTNENDYED